VQYPNSGSQRISRFVSCGHFGRVGCVGCVRAPRVSPRIPLEILVFLCLCAVRAAPMVVWLLFCAVFTPVRVLGVTQRCVARLCVWFSACPPEATGRTLRLNWGGGKRPPIPSAGAAPMMSAMPQSGPETSLFVGDLPFDANDSTLLAVFGARYPTVVSAKVREV
jgi:hypothetical protein